MMTYLLQVSTCWIVFYGIYMLFMQKETFFSINRYYLLGALSIGLMIPLLGGYLPANQTSTEIYHVMEQISEIEITPIIESEKSVVTWLNLLYLVYMLGASIVFLRFIYGLSKIYSIYKNAIKTKYNNYTLVESSKYHLPFSFFHLIFISKVLPLHKDVEKVLRHEELHANQWHSLDIVFAELLQVFFWFNPILLFYKVALKQSHEFLADAYVTKDHQRSSYGQLLLRQSTSGLEIALANHFFHSQIKKRITMMYKEKSKRLTLVKYLIAAPVLIAMLVIFSSSQKSENVQDHNKNIEGTLDENLNSFDFDIRVEEDGSYTFSPTSYTTTDLNQFIHDLKQDKDVLNISIHDKADSKNIARILNFASNNEVKVEISESKELREYTSQKLIESSNNLFGLKSQFEQAQKSNEEQGDPIFKVVEKMPRFPGCEDGKGTDKEKEQCAKQKMLEFIYKNMTYPSEARNEDIEGMCIIQFVVEKNGEISSGKIVRNIGGGCGGEALRVVNSMPEWIPGKQKGQAVRVQYTLPVKFKLEGKDLSNEEKNHMVNVVAFGKKSEKAIKDNLVIHEQNLLLKSESMEEVYKVVEEMPRFAGCENSEMTLEEIKECAKQKMSEFIYTKIKYPREARDKGVEGTAVVQMTIEKDGSVSSTTVIRDPGAGIGIEAKRIVDLMPNWIPGKQRGKKVRVQYVLPIKYKLEGGGQSSKSEKNKILKTSLSVTEEDFKSIESIGALLAETGLSSECKIKEFRLIHVSPKKDATVSQIKEGSFQEFTKKQIQDASVGDRYFFEEIYCQCPEDKEAKNKGGFHVKIISNDEKITIEVDQIPLFPETSSKDESVQSLLDFVFNNITYPEEAKQTGIEGLALVKFVVTAKGQIQKIHLTKSPGWGIDESVIKMMDKMKEIESPWTPAIIDKKNVSYEYVLPVKFKLEEHQKAEVRLKKLDVQALNIKPNPSNGIFTLAFNIEDRTPVDITFYSSTGQTIKSLKAVNVPFTKPIDLTGHKGQTVYFRILQKDKAHTEKIIIQ